MQENSISSDFNVDNIMNELAKIRPVFHSEADFQHAIAMHIQKIYSPTTLRLEIPFQINDSVLHVDLFLILQSGSKIAIELKYKTIVAGFKINEEVFQLKNHSARDCGRYDYLMDVSRLEKMVSANFADLGFAVILSNDNGYWKVPNRNAETDDAEFRIHEGRELKGKMSWPIPLPRSAPPRQDSICLNSFYKATWKNYSKPLLGQNSEFRYLNISVKKNCVSI